MNFCVGFHGNIFVTDMKKKEYGDNKDVRDIADKWRMARVLPSSWGERDWLLFKKWREESKSCVAFISHWICSQPSFLAERKWGSGGRERGFERVKMGMGGGSFSPVWPLSHSNSSLATWMPVPLSSPTAQDLTHSLPDYTSSELEERTLQTDAEPDKSRKIKNNSGQ